MAMNRQTKRMMARQGTDKPKAATQRAAPPPHKEKRIGPREYIGEVRAEMRKVAWPTGGATRSVAFVVLLALVALVAVIGLTDVVIGRLVIELFD